MELAILIIIFDFDRLHILFYIRIYFHPENAIDDFLEYYRTGSPNRSILPKHHILENYSTDFVEKWKIGLRINSKQDGEVIHYEFHQLKITCCWMKPASTSQTHGYAADAFTQKAKRLNSKIIFGEKGKQPCRIDMNWTIASCNWLY